MSIIFLSYFISFIPLYTVSFYNLFGNKKILYKSYLLCYNLIA